VPLWSGDFDELKPELTAGGHGLRLADLPLLTVNDVGQYVIRAAQGGSLRAGPIGTAAHSVVPFPTAGAMDNKHAAIARRLSRNATRTILFMHDMNARSRDDKLTRQFIADELGLDVDDMRVVRTELGKTGEVLIESVDGCRGGWWLSPFGVLVAEYLREIREGSTANVALMKQA
jgi:hypothetical protein